MSKELSCFVLSTRMHRQQAFKAPFNVSCIIQLQLYCHHNIMPYYFGGRGEFFSISPLSSIYSVNNDVSVNTYSSDSLMERKQENFNAGGKDVR